MSGPLAGRHVVVTRPLAQSQALAGMIIAAGGQPIVFPLLEIAPPADTAELTAAVAQINNYALAIFISPNAVDFSLPSILAHGSWPLKLLPAAIGQGTVRALAAHGVSGTVAPSKRFDSEALLELPALQADQVAGRRVLIFRGDGGRELLAETLRERGAAVDCIPCYSRRAPADGAGALLTRWQGGSLDALTISSSEGLRYLVDMLDEAGLEYLAETPVFVPHQRIRENAVALGLRRVVLTGPADAGIIEGLCTYNWAQS